MWRNLATISIILPSHVRLVALILHILHTLHTLLTQRLTYDIGMVLLTNYEHWTLTTANKSRFSLTSFLYRRRPFFFPLSGGYLLLLRLSCDIIFV
jgi:hypothetical protein